jgi:hypothetical protein
MGLVHRGQQNQLVGPPVPAAVVSTTENAPAPPTDDDHNVWDCDNLTTWISSPPRPWPDEDVVTDNEGMFWMKTVYTALQDNNEKFQNAFGGTCQSGQLLLQGYAQELENGRFLRQAYVYQGDDDYGHDVKIASPQCQDHF